MPFQETLAAQHRACDAIFVHIDQSAHRGDWTAATAAAEAFVTEIEAHLAYEEQTLFPALEAASPAAAGPTAVMRSEHAQMRELFAALAAATRAHDAQLLADVTETLLLLMQQHNAKEENVLYPIADRILSTDLLAATGPNREGR